MRTCAGDRAPRTAPSSARQGAPPRPPAAGRLRPLAGILALLCLAAVLEVHPAAEILGAASPWSGEAAWASCHPGLAVHMEAATASRPPTCPACLLRLATAGAHLPDAACVAGPLAGGHELETTAVPLVSRSSSPSQARGPPRA